MPLYSVMYIIKHWTLLVVEGYGVSKFFRNTQP